MAPTLYDEKLQPGDLIEIDRGAYQHWAVYVGDGFIIHLAAPSEVADAGASSIMSLVADRAVVKKEKLWDVAGTNQWRVNNSLDKKYQPRPIRVIVREACAMVGDHVPYSIFTMNCEHFANNLRYGNPESRQVAKAAGVVVASGVAGMVVFGALVLGRALFGGSKNKTSD